MTCAGHWTHPTQLERTVVQCTNHSVVHAHMIELLKTQKLYSLLKVIQTEMKMHILACKRDVVKVSQTDIF